MKRKHNGLAAMASQGIAMAIVAAIVLAIAVAMFYTYKDPMILVFGAIVAGVAALFVRMMMQRGTKIV